MIDLLSFIQDWTGYGISLLYEHWWLLIVCGLIAWWTSSARRLAPSASQLNGAAVFREMVARGESVNNIRDALEQVNPIQIWRGQSLPPTYIPWQTVERRQLFERLLREDKAANFKERITYYQTENARSRSDLYVN